MGFFFSNTLNGVLKIYITYMILSKEIKVKNSSKYKKLGYNSSDKFILVKVNDLPIGSNYEILAKCDFCENVRSISYKEYNKNFKKGNKYACSIKCGSIKAKLSNMEKYGYESHFQINEFKEKIKKTIINKYGVDHISKLESVSKSKSEKMKLKEDEVSERIISFYKNLNKNEIDKISEKREKTNLKRWGVDNVSKNLIIKNKKKEKFKSKYGGFTFESKELSDKVKQTNLEKYGVEYSIQSDFVKEKIKKSNLEKYGQEYPILSDYTKNKIKESNLKKYGVENIILSEEFRKKFDISNELNYLKYLGDRNYEFLCKNCNKNYIIHYDNYYKRKINNIDTCTECCPISELSSIKEKELYEFIKSIYNKDIIRNYRNGLEVDIYLPNLNIGFEFNGLYWHSDKFKDKSYHLNKKNYFEDFGIKIINIWEDDWIHNNEIIKSQIRNWIGLTINKIYARNCEIREIEDAKEYRHFLNDNHIQGYIRSIIKVGLYYNGELISLMTFDNSEGRKKMNENEWNLSRFCNKREVNVIGSFSKLLNYFIIKFKPIRIISFADRDWSDGDIYSKFNFELVKILKPDYKYIINNKRINKQRLTKRKLVKIGYDENLSESKITENLNIQKVYNCGQLKFELKTN